MWQQVSQVNVFLESTQLKQIQVHTWRHTRYKSLLLWVGGSRPSHPVGVYSTCSRQRRLQTRCRGQRWLGDTPSNHNEATIQKHVLRRNLKKGYHIYIFCYNPLITQGVFTSGNKRHNHFIADKVNPKCWPEFWSVITATLAGILVAIGVSPFADRHLLWARSHVVFSGQQWRWSEQHTAWREGRRNVLSFKKMPRRSTNSFFSLSILSFTDSWNTSIVVAISFGKNVVFHNVCWFSIWGICCNLLLKSNQNDSDFTWLDFPLCWWYDLLKAQQALQTQNVGRSQYFWPQL